MNKRIVITKKEAEVLFSCASQMELDLDAICKDADGSDYDNVKKLFDSGMAKLGRIRDRVRKP